MDDSSHSFRFGFHEIAACWRLVELGLDEDLAGSGDVTSLALVPKDDRGEARFVAREAGVVAGLEAAQMALEAIDPDVRWESQRRDGVRVVRGELLASVTGSLRSLLAAERTALNVVQRLSGVATATRAFVDAVAGTPAAIYDTRKTTPGWRVLEKYAVRVGGGHNHRMGLFDAVLIKDNHIVAWELQQVERPLADAIRTARAAVPAGTFVEIEVDSIEQLEDALPGEPDIVLLDNFTPALLRAAVAIRNARLPGLILEASGGITLETVREVAETGVDRISVGAITHSAPALDIALDFDEPCVAT